jgi:hypothetical protein
MWPELIDHIIGLAIGWVRAKISKFVTLVFDLITLAGVGALMIINFIGSASIILTSIPNTAVLHAQGPGSATGLAAVQAALYEQEPLLLVLVAMVLLVALVGAAVFFRRRK